MMKNVRNIPLIICLYFSLSIIVIAQSSYPILEKNIKAKQYLKAYQRALKLRDKSEGDPRFDYLYGLSALQTGHYNEAVFALDRVTVATPRVIRPRLDLARAYLKLNNKTAAIKEFNDVLALSPPPIVRKNVSAYLNELQRGSKDVKKSIVKRLASFSIGYDDNINFGTSNREVDLPGFGLVTLNSSAIKQKSGFAEAKFQIMQKKIRNKSLNTFLLTNVTYRKYFKKTDFDSFDLDFSAGVGLTKNDRQYQFIIRDRPHFLNGKLYSNTLGFDAIIRKSLGKGNILSSYLSLENYNNKKVSLTNRNRALLGVKLDQVAGDNQHQFNAYLGKEFANKKEGKQFSRNIIGAGYKASYEWNSQNISFLNIDYKHYKHQDKYPVFPNKREDNRFIVKATHERYINDKTTLVFSASHVNNNSNLDLYDAKKNEVKIGIRYEWD